MDLTGVGMGIMAATAVVVVIGMVIVMAVTMDIGVVVMGTAVVMANLGYGNDKLICLTSKDRGFSGTYGNSFPSALKSEVKGFAVSPS